MFQFFHNIPPKRIDYYLDRMEDDIPKNTIIYDYADKYPEDVPKLLEFFESRKNEDDTRRKDTYAFIRRQDPNKEAEKRIFNEYIKYGLENLTPDINTDEEGCLLCRKSWESTQNMQKITLLHLTLIQCLTIMD